VFSNRPNMGGGALAATIGNAHVVEQMLVANTIAAGNTVNGEAADVFSGSLLRFLSGGGNLVGLLTLKYLLVPVPRWGSLCRSHWPEEGDAVGVAAGDVLDLAGAATDPEILSAGADEGAAAVLWYPPVGVAVDRVTKHARGCQWTVADYPLPDPWTGRLLNLVLEVLREDYAGVLGPGFGASFGDMTGTTFFTESDTWPSRPENAAWIAFFRAVEAEIAGRLGPAPLSEEFWGAVKRRARAQGEPFLFSRQRFRTRLPAADQRGFRRPAGEAGDAGAVELDAAAAR
jgi:hypothetical protein